MGCGSSSEVQPNTQNQSQTPNMLLKENTGEFKKDYQLKEKIGEGTYGVVRRCQHRLTGEDRVVKRILKKSMRKDEQKLKLVNDVIFLRKIDHPNVIKAYEFYQDQDYFWIVTEYVQGGDLIQRLENKGLLKEKEASNIIKQCLSVLQWSHSHGIMHRDIKPENIMIESTANKEEGYQIKVIDWGTAVEFNNKSHITELVGTPYYVAPEVVSKGKSYNQKCDIWSLGAMLYALLSGEPPIYADEVDAILDKVEEGNWEFSGYIWDTKNGGISREAQDLISKMMVKDPAKRIPAVDALKHQWIQNAPDIELSQEKQQIFGDRLRKFNQKNKLQAAALMFITQQFSQKNERDQLTKAFKLMDKNDDGTLTKEEIVEHFQETMTKDQAENEATQMITKVDYDQNGSINYSEFLMATYDIQKHKLKEQLRMAFTYFDQDGNGFITTDELQKFLGPDIKDNNENAWNNILSQNDQDNDGQISFDEFCKMMEVMADQEQQSQQQS